MRWNFSITARLSSILPSIFVYAATTCVTRQAYELQPHQVKLYSFSCKHQARKDIPLLTLHTSIGIQLGPTSHTLAPQVSTDNYRTWVAAIMQRRHVPRPDFTRGTLNMCPQTI
ncbi:hypothetical protein T265_14887, partial [Opisthorchis viverrini]